MVLWNGTEAVPYNIIQKTIRTLPSPRLYDFEFSPESTMANRPTKMTKIKGKRRLICSKVNDKIKMCAGLKRVCAINA